MNRHPVEALLRPPVELWSAVVAFATAGIAVLAPWVLMMPPGVAYAAAGALALLGWRGLYHRAGHRRRRRPHHPLNGTEPEFIRLIDGKSPSNGRIGHRGSFLIDCLEVTAPS